MMQIVNASQLVDQLTALRKEKGMSQAQLAEAVGVSRSMISYFEAKKVFLRFNTLLALMHQLGMEVYFEEN